MEKNHLPRLNSVEEKRRLARLGNVLSRYFEKWMAVFQTHEVTKIQMAVYLEAVKDLSVGELEDGCREVIKTALTFPKPAEIIEAAKHQAKRSGEFLGPKMIEYPEITEEEREAAIAENADATAKLKAQLGKPEVIKSPAAGNKITTVPTTKSWEEQKRELERRGYLGTKPHDPRCLCPACRQRRERM